MDESHLSCSICEELFTNARVPRSLSCGHSFCHDCLRHILETDKKCPECRRDIAAQKAEEMPVNYTVMRMAASFAEKQSTINMELTVELPLTREGEKCDEHGSGMFFVCMKCRVWVCRDCLVVDHPDPPRGHCRIVSAKEALKEMKHFQKRILRQCVQEVNIMSEAQEKEGAILSSLENYYENEIGKLQAKKEKVRPLHQRLDNRRSELIVIRDKIYQSLSLLNKVTSTVELKSITEKLKECQNDLGNFASKESKRILFTGTDNDIFKDMLQSQNTFYAATEDEGKEKWSPVIFSDGQILLYSLRPGKIPEDGTLFSFRCVRDLVPQESPLIFLDIGWDGKFKGRVYVRMFGDTPRSRQAVLLSSGERGPSYRNSVFYQYDHKAHGLCNLLRGGDYEKNDGSGGRSIVEGITDGGIYRHPIEAGLMVGWPQSEDWRLGSFDFYLNDVPSQNDLTAFGKVEKGLHILKQASGMEPISRASVLDCGLVIPVV